jgi:hypothetical protein
MFCAFGLYWLLEETSMHRDHSIFIRAIKERRKIRLAYSKEEGNSNSKEKLIIPMDYHLGHRVTDKSDCYYFWDFEEANNGVPLILESDKIISMEMNEESFDPSEFVIWDVRELPWFVKRDWGKFSW